MPKSLSKSGLKLLVLTLKTACRFESVSRDRFLFLLIFMLENVCSHMYVDANTTNIKSKSNLHYSRYYAEACNERRGPSPRLSAWATQLRRNVAMMASRWRHCADLTGLGIEPQTSRTESMRLANELTAGINIFLANSLRFLNFSG